MKHFPCWYTFISTQVEIAKVRNCVETRLPQEYSTKIENREIFHVILSYINTSILANASSEFANTIL